MNNKNNPPQPAADEPDRPLQGMGLGAAMVEFPRLFNGEQPRIPSWVLPGWQPLIKRLLTSIDTVLTDAEAQEFRVIQVKEKLGTLSFYFRSSERVMEQLDTLVDRACDESATICMKCGQPAKLTNNAGWIAALCTDHQSQPLKSLGDL
jgi:hypothetical protein